MYVYDGMAAVDIVAGIVRKVKCPLVPDSHVTA
jgi:hypothetical protein